MAFQPNFLAADEKQTKDLFLYGCDLRSLHDAAILVPKTANKKVLAMFKIFD